MRTSHKKDNCDTNFGRRPLAIPVIVYTVCISSDFMLHEKPVLIPLSSFGSSALDSYYVLNLHGFPSSYRIGVSS